MVASACGQIVEVKGIMVSTTLSSLSPAEVHGVLSRHIFADGEDLVLDFDRSEGAYLFDAKSSRRFLDFMTFFASNPLGYNHPKMKDAEFRKRLLRVAEIKPSLSDFYSVEYAQFVETFAQHCKPEHFKYAFFIEGGALAVENTLKVAFDWKVRRNRAKGIAGERGHQILHFKEAFHGRSGYTLSLTNTDPAKTDLYPKFSWPRVDNPKLVFPQTEETERDVRAREQQALDQIEAAFAQAGDDIAGILIEPIQGEGGDNHFSGEFLQTLERIAHEQECFFIVDEVQTGIGMTGKMWAYEHFGLKPDALAFGKKTQCCGCLVGGRVDEEPQNVFKVRSRINSTWGGNLTDMVRFARILEIVDQDGLIENARVTGERLLTGLRGLERERSGLLRNARGRGLLVAFDLETPERRKLALQAFRERGLLALPCGAQSVRFRPPLSVTAADVDAGLQILRDGMKSI